MVLLNRVQSHSTAEAILNLDTMHFNNLLTNTDPQSNFLATENEKQQDGHTYAADVRQSVSPSSDFLRDSTPPEL